MSTEVYGPLSWKLERRIANYPYYLRDWGRRQLSNQIPTSSKEPSGPHGYGEDLSSLIELTYVDEDRMFSLSKWRCPICGYYTLRLHKTIRGWSVQCHKPTYGLEAKRDCFDTVYFRTNREALRRFHAWSVLSK